MTLITSTRMYDVAPSARKAWADLLQAVHARAGLRIETILHGWPTPIGELWSRPGLCGAFMCGWPFAAARRAGRQFAAVAGVVPDWPAYEGRARYRSEFLVRADAPWRTLDEALGCRYGWMVEDSQSGWNAPRAMLAERVPAHGGTLFTESKGPYGNPRGLLRALADDEIDLTAIDGWYLDLLRVHDPDVLEGLRTLAHTPWTPNPLLVCGPDVDSAIYTSLSSVLLALHEDASMAPLLRQAHVARFVAVDPADYDVLPALADSARKRGYAAIR